MAESIQKNLEKGMRAMTLRVNLESATAGFTLPGSRVDVICNVQDVRDSRIKLTKLFLQNVLVLAVNHVMAPPQEGPGLVNNPAVLTIAVSPEDAEKVLATPQTPFLIYSGSKAVTAFVVHVLVDHGLLDLEDPVATYIPEYAAGGKGRIAIGQVLAHRSGVPNLPREAFDLDRVSDRQFILDALCAAKPFGKPGEFLAYHAVSGGFILGEVVQRVTGNSTSPKVNLVSTVTNPPPRATIFAYAGGPPSTTSSTLTAVVRCPTVCAALAISWARGRAPPTPARWAWSLRKRPPQSFGER